MSGVVQTPPTSKDMIIGPLTGKEEQKVDMNTMNEDVENRREKTKIQENNIVSSKQFKPYLGPQLSLKEQDEKSCSRKWRERFLGRAHSSSSIEDIVGADVRVLSLTIICPGRPEIVLSHPFVSTPKSSLFTLKEGTKYQLKFSFMVYNNVVSGLQYMNTLWKSGIRVDRSKLMLGNFCPNKEPYGYKLEEEVIPCGILVRGSYSARIKVVDDEGKCYLDIHYYFDIKKNWPTSCVS
ncbi:Rho GDP-dissociation inhibitor 1 [Abeliophyllum distichum]|uniref:Rho GDP-dissociation inhibitor 1 n=1 Tax=Abeliophyllum distichum TaxID=126358 RepID=A0ABD1Q1Y2_9LAMI